jgi:hypothetical protein
MTASGNGKAGARVKRDSPVRGRNSDKPSGPGRRRLNGASTLGDEAEWLLGWQSAPLDGFADVDVTTRGFTELRVHGVSSPPPESVLEFPAALVTLVDGNADSGFWRRWRVGGRAQDVDEPDKKHLEAFCWGGLTSRAALQALWLLLLPFSLVNVAHWMVPAFKPGRRWLAQVSFVLLRALALSLTLTLLLSGAEVAMDLGAWQCGANKGCADALLPGSFAAHKSVAFRLVAAAVVLSLLLVLLWRAGLTRWRPLRQGEDAPKPAVPRSGPDGADPVLGRREFWKVDKSTRWLRALHAAAWCAGIGAICTAVVVDSTAGSSRGHLISFWLAALNLAVVGGVFLLVLLPERFGRGGTGVQNTTWIGWVVGAAIVLLVVSLAATVAYLPASADSGRTLLPFVQGAFVRLALVQAALLLALLVCVIGLARGHRRGGTGNQPKGFQPFLGGILAVVIAYLGWLVALVFTAGFGLWEADRLKSTLGPAVMPAIFNWIDLAALAFLAVVALVALVILVQVIRPTTVAMAMLTAGRRVWDRRWQQVPPDRRDDKWKRPPEWEELNKKDSKEENEEENEEEKARALAAARWQILAQHVEWVPGVLGLASLSSLAVFAYATLAYFHRSAGSPWFPDGLQQLGGIGANLVTYGTGALIVLAFAAFQNQGTRRLVGILWDVMTFWPRANHPLTPACSAQRAVPQLVDRADQLTKHPSDWVVLSLHSQGCILGAAAALQMSRDNTLNRSAVLSYGNPLRRLYARAFPAYFPFEVLQRLYRDLDGRWLNLWATTDPIGGPLFPDGSYSPVARQDPFEASAFGPRSEALPLREAAGQLPGPDIDWEMLPDPLTVGVDARTGEGVPVCDHSGYLHRPEYQVALARLRQLDDAPRPPARIHQCASLPRGSWVSALRLFIARKA